MKNKQLRVFGVWVSLLNLALLTSQNAIGATVDPASQSRVYLFDKCPLSDKRRLRPW